MTTFADDFNRADGPVGNGWTVGGVQTRILSGEVASSSNGFIFRVLTANSPYHRVEWDSRKTPSTNAHCPGAVKSNGAYTQHYYGSFAQSTNGYTVTIGYRNGLVNYSLANGSVVMAHTNPVRGTLTYDAGALTLTINGTVVLTANDNRYAANDYIGVLIGNVANFADNVLLADAPAVAFDAAPEPLVDMAIPEEVQFTGEGTAWEPGTPGQPIFQVDKGTLDSQTVTSATTAAAMYTPPQAEDDATFTDPSTGLTDVVHLSTGFQVDGGAGLSEDAVDYIERSAQSALAELGHILNTDSKTFSWETEINLPSLFGDLHMMMRTQSGSPPGDPPVTPLLDVLWWILNGHAAFDPEENIFDNVQSAWAAATNAETGITAWRTVSAYTAQDILDAIEATIPPDLSGIVAELAAIRTANLLTLQSPIDAVEAARGAGLPTIKDVTDELATIRTVNNWTFGNVYGWYVALGNALAEWGATIAAAIATSQGVIGGWITAAKEAIMGFDSVDLTQIHDQVGQFAIDTTGHFGHIDTAIADVRGDDSRDLTQVYDAILALPQSQVDLGPVLTAIANLSAKIDALSFGPVLWPGAAGVDFGAPVALGGEQTIVGPMDGAVIEIAGSGEGKSRYGSGDWTNKYRMGWYMFVGSGDWAEDFRWLGPNRQVLTPQRLLTASKLVLYCYPGVGGTITPWTLKVS